MAPAIYREQTPEWLAVLTAFSLCIWMVAACTGLGIPGTEKGHWRDARHNLPGDMGKRPGVDITDSRRSNKLCAIM